MADETSPGNRRHREARAVVLRRLLAAGDEVRVVSRRAPPAGEARPFASMRFDLRKANGIDSVFAGVDTVIHCASSPRCGDVDAAYNVIAAARRPEVSHLVYISIVGVDRVPLGSYRTKLAVERMIANSGLPWTTLRTTQFHDLVLGLWMRQARPPFCWCPLGQHPADRRSRELLVSLS